MRYAGDVDNSADLFKKHVSYHHQREMKFVWPYFDYHEVATSYHRWCMQVVDVDTGDIHMLEEALEDRGSDWMYDVKLPAVMVKVAPPMNVVKLTLD